MKKKDLTIQDTKSLTTPKNEKKNLSVKEKNVALAKTKKEETSIVKSKKKETSLTKTKKEEKAVTTIKDKQTALVKSSAETKRATKKQPTTKKATTKEATKSKTASTRTKTTSTKTKTAKKSTKKEAQDFTIHANEYFDLPYRYNETIVKLLAQTPKRLFVYWDVSDKDRESYIKAFGQDFFNNTIPFLRIKNETQNYTFDIDINDFANSWYVNINDDNSKYSIELYRRFKDNSSIQNKLNNTINNNTSNNTVQATGNTIQPSSNAEQNDNILNNDLLNITIINNAIFIATSNEITAPNGKVLSINYTYPRKVEYRNIKTNQISYKHIDKPNNEFYKMLFKDEIYDYDTKINASSSRF